MNSLRTKLAGVTSLAVLLLALASKYPRSSFGTPARDSTEARSRWPPSGEALKMTRSPRSALFQPLLTRLQKHNHISEIATFNTADEYLGREVVEFVQRGLE
jgi:hypothetical protein